MPRAMWSGAISFGLVSVPVKMYPAVRSKTVRFNQLDSADGSRIQQKRVNAGTGEEVPYERLVKGFEISPDRYVVIEPSELEALSPKKTRTIEIEDFVELDEIDPVLYDAAYYLVPGPGGAKPYRLLLEAMKETGRVAIARVVIRTKEALVALRPMGGGEVLGCSTMVFHDEVVDPSTLDEVPAAEDVKTTKRELDIAKQLVESLSAEWEPDRYADTYRDQVLDLIERKASGEEIAVVEAPEAPDEEVPDLMAALKASLDAVRKPDGSADGGAKKKTPSKRAPAKKTTAKSAGKAKSASK
jgi:DNA end-binding protein Ku